MLEEFTTDLYGNLVNEGRAGEAADFILAFGEEVARVCNTREGTERVSGDINENDYLYYYKTNKKGNKEEVVREIKSGNIK